MSEKTSKTKVRVLKLRSLSLPSGDNDASSVHYLPGDELELDADEAAALIEQGFAEKA